MIATGLCVMGGCFAQDGGGAVQEAYWPAEMVDISYPEVVALNITSFPGGDSQNDFYKARVFLDVKTPPAAIVNNTIPFGYANASVGGGWISSGAYLTIRSSSTFRFTYDGASQDKASISGWVDVLSQNNTCEWRFDSSLYMSLEGTYSLPDDLTRKYVLRTGQIRQFCYMAYRNARTEVRWLVSAMCSPMKSEAVWFNDNLILVEI